MQNIKLAFISALCLCFLVVAGGCSRKASGNDAVPSSLSEAVARYGQPLFLFTDYRRGDVAGTSYNGAPYTIEIVDIFYGVAEPPNIENSPYGFPDDGALLAFSSVGIVRYHVEQSFRYLSEYDSPSYFSAYCPPRELLILIVNCHGDVLEGQIIMSHHFELLFLPS